SLQRIRFRLPLCLFLLSPPSATPLPANPSTNQSVPRGISQGELAAVWDLLRLCFLPDHTPGAADVDSDMDTRMGGGADVDSAFRGARGGVGGIRGMEAGGRDGSNSFRSSPPSSYPLLLPPPSAASSTPICQPFVSWLAVMKPPSFFSSILTLLLIFVHFSSLPSHFSPPLPHPTPPPPHPSPPPPHPSSPHPFPTPPLSTPPHPSPLPPHFPLPLPHFLLPLPPSTAIQRIAPSLQHVHSADMLSVFPPLAPLPPFLSLPFRFSSPPSSFPPPLAHLFPLLLSLIFSPSSHSSFPPPPLAHLFPLLSLIFSPSSCSSFPPPLAHLFPLPLPLLSSSSSSPLYHLLSPTRPYLQRFLSPIGRLWLPALRLAGETQRAAGGDAHSPPLLSYSLSIPLAHPDCPAPPAFIIPGGSSHSEGSRERAGRSSGSAAGRDAHSPPPHFAPSLPSPSPSPALALLVGSTAFALILS
ncbi:unnamed protein product, partial [Closterium sp. NIES-54]